MHKCRNFTTFVQLNNLKMKYSELIRLIERNGWLRVRQNGSHIIYEKNGKRYTVPNHGSKEIAKGLERKIKRDMEL